MQTSSLRRTALRVGILASSLALAGVVMAAPLGPQAQTGQNASAAARPAAAQLAGPPYHEYRGVSLGMKADEVRAKLGEPTSSDQNSDTFMRSDKETAVVYYNKDRNVIAVVTTYSGSDAGAPDPKAVFGTEVKAGDDGTITEMVRYQDAGFWVSYNRIPGEPPMTIVTIRKMN